MSDFIQGFQTSSGERKYDYNALGNLPDLSIDIKSITKALGYTPVSPTEVTTLVKTAMDTAEVAKNTAISAKVTAEQANTEVNSLRNTISNFHSNIVESISGEKISIIDSSNMNLINLKIFGKTKQLTTTGKNLCSGIKNGAYLAGNGIYEKGVPNYFCTEIIPIAPDDLYSLSNNINANISDIHFFDSTSTWLGRFDKDKLNDRPDNATFMAFNFYKTEGLEWVQVEKGEVVTAYEPYTGGIPSPSPTYPQELKDVGKDGDIKVKIYGKNLLQNNGSASTVNGITFMTKEDGSIIVDGKATTQVGYSINSERMKNGTYILNGSSVNVKVFVILRKFDTSVQYINSVNGADAIFTIDDTVESMGVIAQVSSDVVVENESIYPMIRCVEIVNNNFEPFTIQQLTLSSLSHLPGIPVLHDGNYIDENGQQWICDEINLSSGKYIQRIGVRTVESSVNQVWGELSSGMPYIELYHPSSERGSDIDGGLSNVYLQASTTTNNTFRTTQDTILICDERFTDLNTGIALLAEMDFQVYYILKNAVETDLSAEEITQYSALHTNYLNTTVYNDEEAYMGVQYVADTKTYIDNKFEQLAQVLLNKI